MHKKYTMGFSSNTNLVFIIVLRIAGFYVIFSSIFKIIFHNFLCCLLHCTNFSNERLTFFDKLQSIDANIVSKDDSSIWKLLHYGDHSFNDEKNTSNLTASVEYKI